MNMAISKINLLFKVSEQRKLNFDIKIKRYGISLSSLIPESNIVELKYINGYQN